MSEGKRGSGLASLVSTIRHATSLLRSHARWTVYHYQPGQDHTTDRAEGTGVCILHEHPYRVVVSVTPYRMLTASLIRLSATLKSSQHNVR